MKWSYRIFTFVILGGAMAMPFMINNKQGEKMLSMDDFLPSSMGGKTTAPKNVTVYKWQDQWGKWQFGDTPPAGAQNVQVMTVSTKINTMQAVKIPPKEDPNANLLGSRLLSTAEGGDDVLSLERAKNIINETREVAAAMEDRNTQLDALVSGKAE